MAAIEAPQHSNHHQGKRMNKKSTKVDLTPMVDLGFLLITFFVFTTTMAKPTAMNIQIPYGDNPDDGICNSCVLTTLLNDNDEIKYYEGSIDTAIVHTTNYSSIRDIIQQKKKKVQMITGNADRFVLIIKPIERSTFKNFVDITDEATINLVKRYYIDDPTDTEISKVNL